MNKRLQQLIDKGAIPNKGGVFIDSYNQSVNEDVAGTITTRIDASNMSYVTEPKIIERDTPMKGNYKEPRVLQIDNLLDDSERKFKNPQTGRIYDTDGLSPTVNTCQGGGREPKIAEPLCIPQATEQGYVEVPQGAVFDGSYPNSKTRRGRLQDGGQTSPTLMASGESPCYYEGVKESTYRIRKLTERECFRLMGVSESDIDKIQASGVSRSQQYKMAGNSIVVDVLEHIFRKLFVETGQESQQLWMF